MNKITKNVLSLALILTVFGLPMLVGAQFDPTREMGNTKLSNTSVYDIIKSFLNWTLMILTVVAVLGFVISGLMFITAGGNNDRLESAKSWLMYSIIGIVVGLIGYIAINFVVSFLAP